MTGKTNELEGLLDSIANDIVKHGEVVGEVIAAGKTFKIRPLTAQTFLISRSIDVMKEFNEESKNEEFNTYTDVFKHLRNISSASFYIYEIDGVTIHDKNDTQEEMLKKAKMLRKMLIKLPSKVIDLIALEYNKVEMKASEAFNNLEEVVKK